MAIEGLNKYFLRFNLLAKGDAFINAGEDKEAYEKLIAEHPSSKEEYAKDKKIDFWEYMEAVAPGELKDVKRVDVIRFSEKAALSATPDLATSASLLINIQEDGTEVSRDEELKNTAFSAFLENLSKEFVKYSPDAKFPEIVNSVFGHLKPADKAFRTKLIEELISGMNKENNSHTSNCTIRSLCTIYLMLADKDTELKKTILDTLVNRTNGYDYESILVTEEMTKTYLAMPLKEKAFLTVLMQLLYKCIKAPKRYSTDTKDNSSFYSSLADIYGSLGKDEKVHKGDIIVLLSQRAGNEPGALRALAEIYVKLPAGEQTLKNRIFNMIMNNLDNKSAEIAYSAYNSLNIIYKGSPPSDKTLRAKIAGILVTKYPKDPAISLSSISDAAVQIFYDPACAKSGIKDRLFDLLITDARTSKFSRYAGILSIFGYIFPGLTGENSSYKKRMIDLAFSRIKDPEEYVPSTSIEFLGTVFNNSSSDETAIRGRILDVLKNDQDVDFSVEMAIAETYGAILKSLSLEEKKIMVNKYVDASWRGGGVTEALIITLGKAALELLSEEYGLTVKIVERLSYYTNTYEWHPDNDSVEAIYNIYKITGPEQTDLRSTIIYALFRCMQSQTHADKAAYESLCNIYLGLRPDGKEERNIIVSKITSLQQEHARYDYADIGTMLFIEILKDFTPDRVSIITNMILDDLRSDDYSPKDRNSNLITALGEIYKICNPELKNVIFNELISKGGSEYVWHAAMKALISIYISSKESEGSLRGKIINMILLKAGKNDPPPPEEMLAHLADIYPAVYARNKRLSDRIIDVLLNNLNIEKNQQAAFSALAKICQITDIEDDTLKFRIVCSMCTMRVFSGSLFYYGHVEYMSKTFATIYPCMPDNAKDKILDRLASLAYEGMNTHVNEVIGALYGIYGTLKSSDELARNKVICRLCEIYYTIPNSRILIIGRLCEIYKGLTLQEQETRDFIISTIQAVNMRYDDDNINKMVSQITEGAKKTLNRQLFNVLLSGFIKGKDVSYFFKAVAMDDSSTLRDEAEQILIDALSDSRVRCAAERLSEMVHDRSVDEDRKKRYVSALWRQLTRTGNIETETFIYGLFLNKEMITRLDAERDQRQVIDHFLADDNKIRDSVDVIINALIDYNANIAIKKMVASVLMQKYISMNSGSLKEYMFGKLFRVELFSAIETEESLRLLINDAIATDENLKVNAEVLRDHVENASMPENTKTLIAGMLFERIEKLQDSPLKDRMTVLLQTPGLLIRLGSADIQKQILNRNLSLLSENENSDILKNLNDNLTKTSIANDMPVSIKASIIEKFMAFIKTPSSFKFYSRAVSDDDYEGILAKAQISTALCQNAISAINALGKGQMLSGYMRQVIERARIYMKDKDRNIQDIGQILLAKSYKTFVFGKDKDNTALDADTYDNIVKLYSKPVGPSSVLYADSTIKVKVYFQELMKEAMWVKYYLNEEHGYHVGSVVISTAADGYSIDDFQKKILTEHSISGSSRLSDLLRSPSRMKELFGYYIKNAGKKILMSNISEREVELVNDLLAGRLIKERVFVKVSPKAARIIDKKGREKSVYLRAEVIVPCSPRNYSDFNEHIFNGLTDDPDLDYVVYNGHAGMTLTLNESFKFAKAYFREAIIQLSNCWSKSHLPDIQSKFRYVHPILTSEGAQSKDGCLIFGSTLENMLLGGIDTRYDNIRQSIRKNEFSIAGEDFRELVPDNYFFISDNQFAMLSDIDGDGTPDVIDNDYTFNVIVKFDDHYDLTYRHPSSRATPELKARKVYGYLHPSFSGDPLFLAKYRYEMDQNTEGYHKGWFWTDPVSHEASRVSSWSGEVGTYFIKLNIGYANCSGISLYAMAVYETALSMSESKKEEALKAKVALDKKLFNVAQNQEGKADAEKGEKLAKENLGLTRDDIVAAYERLGISKDKGRQLELVNIARAFLLGAEAIQKGYNYAKTPEDKRIAKALYPLFLARYNLPQVDFDTCLQILDLSDYAPVMWYIAYLAKNGIKLPENMGNNAANNEDE